MTVITRALKGELAKSTIEVEQTFAEVVLGRPTAKCKHLGICKIENAQANNFLDYTLGSASNKLYALASFRAGDYFELSFSRDSVREAIYDKHFASGYFIMEESYRTEASFMHQQFVLEKGKYKVKMTDTELVVRFALAEPIDQLKNYRV
ncbi:hypothetical protein [Lewinella sp. LCG006]|uniref:hypothetical protein n=1 Tax=Lewinella sp. LCG006 TaxID=3231911 RepID=UPI00345F68BB